VQAHMRLADRPIESDLIGRATADLILSMEPLESLRYLEMLAPGGAVVTAAEPVINIPDYPPIAELHRRIRALPHAVLVDADRLAREAGDPLTLNTVIVGAASHLLPLKSESLERAIAQLFARKGEEVLQRNLAAFRSGHAAATGAPPAAAAR
jgi:indolepyruvate ferredoxin oxidoreductase, beta subunit